MLVLLVFGFCGYVLIGKKIDDLRHNDLAAIHKRIDGVESSLSKRIDNVEYSIKELKHNDLAHLNSAIEALTFTLEKNGSLSKEDKKFVDTRLAH